ncbi:MAG TPA: hypothetical protein VEB18_03390 [Candidatus Paceibacterota bacterium]|nr:hypothetical protein [Candidatus Paceibacterota bacterium]
MCSSHVPCGDGSVTVARNRKHRKRRQHKIRHNFWKRSLDRMISKRLWQARRKRLVT